MASKDKKEIDETPKLRKKLGGAIKIAAEIKAAESVVLDNATKIGKLKKMLKKDGTSLERLFNDKKVQAFFEARSDAGLRSLMASPDAERVQNDLSQKLTKLDVSIYDPRIQAALVVAYRETIEFAIAQKGKTKPGEEAAHETKKRTIGEEARKLKSAEKMIKKKYGKAGLKVLGLIASSRTAEDIVKETGLNES
jgi:hypothetical protein